MTLVTATVEDVHGGPDNTVWVFNSLLRQSDDGDSIVSPKYVRVNPVDGAISITLEPGFSAVSYRGKEYVIEVPASGTADLWDLISAAVVFPPGTPPTLVGQAVLGYLASHPLTAGDINDSGTAGRAVLVSETQAQARTATGATTVGAAVYTATNAASARSSLGAPIFTNIAALRSATVSADGQASVSGYYSAGDGGGGLFRWDSTDTSSTDNGGTIITPSGALASSGRWKRVYVGEVNARWFGMHPSGTDNTAALQAAVNWVSTDLTRTPGSSVGGGTVFIPMGYYRFTFDAGTSGLSTITVPSDFVLIRGEGKGTKLTVRSHALPDQLDYFFTFTKSGRGQGGGVRDLSFDGAAQLKWCVYLDTWRDAVFENVSANNIHAGILDAESTDVTDLGENIRVRGLDYIPGSGSDACITQYGVRFRPGTASNSTTWSDCFIQDCLFVGVWDTGVRLDGAVRFHVQNCNSSWNAASTNTIDGTSKSGCLHAVRITNSIVKSWTADTGQHVVDSIYMESHAGTETPVANVAVLVDTPSGQTGINRFNRISNVDISYQTPGPGIVRFVDDTVTALTNTNTFIGNRRGINSGQISLGPGVRDTYLHLTPAQSQLWKIAINDQGTNTYINGVLNTTYRNAAIWPDNTPGTGQVDSGCITRDTATGRVVLQDKFNDSALIGPRAGIDVVSPYGAQRIQALPSPLAPKVNPSGAGSTTWNYYVVAIDKDGNKSIPSAAGTTTVGAATLASGAYNTVTWFPVDGAVKYDLLRGDTAHSVATDLVATHFYDGSGSAITPAAYTPSAVSPPGTLTVDGTLTASSTIELGHASDTTISRSSAGKIAVEGVDVVTVSSAETQTNKTFTTPVINGLATGTGVASAATASTLVSRDSNACINANNVFERFTTTASAAGTTSLSASSGKTQVVTGSTTQTVKLPTTSIPSGAQYIIVNQSTGAVTVQSSGLNTVCVLDAGTAGLFTAVVATPTTAANWDCRYWGVVPASGKSLSVSNTLTLAGTDGTTMTFPGSSDTVVGLAAAQTLPNKTLTSPKITSGNAPATASSTGTVGQIEWASGFVYVCVATNTWQRAAIATW